MLLQGYTICTGYRKEVRKYLGKSAYININTSESNIATWNRLKKLNQPCIKQLAAFLVWLRFSHIFIIVALKSAFFYEDPLVVACATLRRLLVGSMTKKSMPYKEGEKERGDRTRNFKEL